MTVTSGLQPDPTEPPTGYRTQSADTSYDVERRLIRAWQRMSAAEKARQLLDCCRMAEQLSVAGVRLRSPGASEREIFLRAAALRLDRGLMIDVYNWDPERP